jgi:hypothetical protein
VDGERRAGIVHVDWRARGRFRDGDVDVAAIGNERRPNGSGDWPPLSVATARRCYDTVRARTSNSQPMQMIAKPCFMRNPSPIRSAFAAVQAKRRVAGTTFTGAAVADLRPDRGISALNSTPPSFDIGARRCPR